MKKIDFIILSYNSEKYLKQCIESIQNIKSFKIKIHIIDNGSTDKSVSIIKDFKEEKIILTPLNKNYGTTISRNIGLKQIVDTDYICILDSDTIINENAIDIMVKYLDQHNEVGLVGPSMKGINNEKQTPFRKFPSWKIKLCKACPIKKIQKKGEYLENYTNVTDEFECDYLISACWMMKYNTYKKIGELDERIFYSPEDVEYCMRIRKDGYKIVHLRKAEIIHFYQRISKKKLLSKANLTHLYGIHYVLKKYKNFLKEYKERGEN